MPFNHLILCHPLLLPPSIFPSIRAFSNESVLCIRWPKYWSFGFSISPSNEYSGLISFRMDWLDLLAVQPDSQESSPTPQFKSINSSVLSFLYSPTLCNPMDCSTPGFPACLPKFAQTHVHQVSDAIQPSHPLSFPPPSVLNLSQHQGLFQWVSSSHQVAKVFGVSASAPVLPVNI